MLSWCLLGIYWVSIGYLLGIYWLSTGYLLGIYWVSTGYLLGIYWVPYGLPALSSGTSSSAWRPTWAVCVLPTLTWRPRHQSGVPSSCSGPTKDGPSSGCPTSPCCVSTRSLQSRSHRSCSCCPCFPHPIFPQVQVSAWCVPKAWPGGVFTLVELVVQGFSK